MDKDVGREIIRTVFRCGAELQLLLPMLKRRCSERDYAEFARQVATAVDSINVALLDKVIVRFPELKAEIEENLRRSGRAMP